LQNKKFWKSNFLCSYIPSTSKLIIDRRWSFSFVLTFQQKSSLPCVPIFMWYILTFLSFPWHTKGDQIIAPIQMWIYIPKVDSIEFCIFYIWLQYNYNSYTYLGIFWKKSRYQINWWAHFYIGDVLVLADTAIFSNQADAIQGFFRCS
jgi:hypothetical protein